MRGPALHRRFLVRPVNEVLSEVFSSEAFHFPSLQQPLFLSKTPGARMLPGGIPTVSETSVPLGLAGVDHLITAGLFPHGRYGKLLSAYVIKRLKV